MQGFLNNPLLALESIQFQDLSFFRELTIIFAELAKLPKKEISESELSADLSRCVAKHTGLKISFDLGNMDPCVEIPAVNRNNTLINQWLRNFISSGDGLRMIDEAGNVARGGVNLKTGKVSGIFTEMPTTIHLKAAMLAKGSKYTPEENAGITLHEVGHIFTYCEFMSRMVTTNQALAGIAKALDSAGTPDEREMVFISAKKALGLNELDAKELAKTNNHKVVETVVITNVVAKSIAELGSNIYDLSSWEYLADQYAARHGAGRHVVSGLDKLYRGMFHISFRSTPMYVAMEALKLLGVAMLFISPSLGKFTLDISFMMLLRDGQGDGTYDTPEARFRRVRNQVVEALKHAKLSEDDVQRLKADLVALDDILKRVNDRRQLIGLVSDTLAFWSRGQRNQKKLQQELEALAANDLFVKAQEFKQLARA